MLLLSLILPFVVGILCFLIKPAAKYLALGAAAALTGIGISMAFAAHGGALSYSIPWIPQLGVHFSLFGDTLSTILMALSGIVLLAVMLMQQNKEVENSGAFYGLLMMSIAGINGVFLASDGLLFYFFWELALIPIYFLCSQWGGERRIPITFKFFVYTFVGSLMMLAALIYLHSQTPDNSYAWADLMAVGQHMPHHLQLFLFGMMFVAFAIKMPLFPLHTWQPDTYEVAPMPATIILSALMVKMGLYGVLRWVIPFFPDATAHFSTLIITLSVIGIVYASCLALVQNDLKRLVAYSSIAHMGLMVAAAFSLQSLDAVHAGFNTATQGIIVQMFNHGINITGMWLIVQMIENRYGTRDMTKLGGMSSAAPWMSIALVIIAFANIALPLTNGFVGEFLLFNGIFQSASQYNVLFMVIAGSGVILGAVYTLRMVQKVAYGESVIGERNVDMSANEWWSLAVVVTLIIFLGVYPQAILNLLSL